MNAHWEHFPHEADMGVCGVGAMELGLFTRRSAHEGAIPRHEDMRVPAVIFASEALVREMDQKVLYDRIPAGVGSTGAIRLGPAEMDAMLVGQG